MSTPLQTPTITIDLTDDDEYVLMAESYGQRMPAGVRLFRCRPEHYPDVEFRHPTLAQAQEHAARLQTYVNAPHKAEKARGKEEEEVAAVETGPRDRGWWED